MTITTLSKNRIKIYHYQVYGGETLLDTMLFGLNQIENEIKITKEAIRKEKREQEKK